ncbi:MAG TPA: hypothetical protein VJ371_21440 [Streptosporangiaceae bacterium]|nr:hypothetical protein [Streptosporangiaceae bacterium]
MNPGGGSGWDEPPLDVQIPDDARELDRDVIAYHRELRARRRRRRLRRLTSPFSGPGTVMPLLASILAVCLVAGAMLSVATFSPATGPEHHGHPSATAASGAPSAALRSSAPTSTTQTSAAASGTASARPSGTRGTARPSGSANSSARSARPASVTNPPHPPGGP